MRFVTYNVQLNTYNFLPTTYHPQLTAYDYNVCSFSVFIPDLIGDLGPLSIVNFQLSIITESAPPAPPQKFLRARFRRCTDHL